MDLAGGMYFRTDGLTTVSTGSCEALDSRHVVKALTLFILHCILRMEPTLLTLRMNLALTILKHGVVTLLVWVIEMVGSHVS